MKIFFALIFSCFATFAADTGIQIVSTVRTNDSGSILLKDIFTRNGETNLIRSANVKDGVTRMQVQQLYHAGARVGILAVSPEGGSVATEAGSPFALDIEYDAARQLKYAGILSPAGVVVDAFVCTNGVLVPVPNAALDAAADMAPDVKKLMSPERKRSPEQFHQEADQMIQKANK